MRFTLLILLAATLPAEERTLTLPESIALALKQNPDIVLARLEQQKADLAIRIARDPFFPKAYIGSGLAYNSGFPMSIEGAEPSVVQAKGIASLFNKPLSHRVLQAREQARTAGLDVELRQNEIAHQTAVLYIDAVPWDRAAGSVRAQVDSLQRAGELIGQRVAAGRELEIEAKRSAPALWPAGGNGWKPLNSSAITSPPRSRWCSALAPRTACAPPLRNPSASTRRNRSRPASPRRLIKAAS